MTNCVSSKSKNDFKSKNSHDKINGTRYRS